MLRTWCFLFFLSSISIFGQQRELPEYLYQIEERDSVFLTSKNTFKYPIHIIILDSLSKEVRKKVLLPKDSIVLLKYPRKKFNKASIVRNYSFQRNFGDPFIKKYDTLYPYLPPFRRGNRYKVIQAYNGKYTHNSLSSRYALDFQMPIGDTVCAARKGIVIKIQDK